jgi:hypothetical protein
MRTRYLLIALGALIVGSATTTAAVSNHSASLAASKSDVSRIRPAQRAAGSPSEEAIRLQIGEQVHALFLDYKFQQLDAMEQSYRTSGERTPGGLPKLAQFHGWLQYTLPRAETNDGCAFAAGPILDMWQKKSPDSPSVYIARAASLVARAWCFRGDGYAAAVNDDAWAPFHENIAAAEQVLAEHRALVSKDPEYYVVMEDIYKAEGRDRAEFQSLLNEAAAAAPDYYPIYWGAYYYNQPQWYGSYEDIDAAARFAVEHTRAKEGLSVYARYYWHASEDNCSCWTKAVDWPTMKKGMRAIADRYPEPWNLANFAKLACKMNDGPTAKAYFQALGKFDGSEAWAGDTAGWQQCRTLAGL